MVVNNSSAALSALGFRTPVKVLGHAFFDFDGADRSAAAGRLLARAASPLIPSCSRAFRAHVIARTQINGNYHEPRAMRPTAGLIADAFARRAD